MRRLLAVLVCMVSLAGCDDGSASANNPRLVDQDRLDNPIVPIEHVDKAVQTEAIQRMRIIADRVKLTAATDPDNKQALYRSLSGSLDSTKLAKIGLTESDLKGQYYKASDYSVVIVGNELTIHAAQIGSRGRVEPQKFRIP